MAYVSIDYSGQGKSLKYIAIKATINGEEKKFASGDFVKDWFFCNYELLSSKDPYTTHSSSVNHFIMDGGDKRYDSAYICLENHKWDLKYIDKSDPDWMVNQQETYDGIEMFVPKGKKWTMKQLADYCGWVAKNKCVQINVIDTNGDARFLVCQTDINMPEDEIGSIVGSNWFQIQNNVKDMLGWFITDKNNYTIDLREWKK